MTPCEDWDIQALVAHVVNTHWRVSRTTGQEANVQQDWVDQWESASSAIKQALADPVRSHEVTKGMFGEQSFSDLVGQLLCSDTLYHTWDLARASGQDEQLDPDAVAKALEFLTPLDEAIRRPGGFGPKVSSAPNADIQTRFLNFGGRVV
jgi:uncharacterized protein (TIGR03086 family)